MSKQQSIFAAYIDKYFRKTVGKVTELYNGRKTEEQYLHEQLLDKEYTADLTWNSTTLNNSIVAADVVAMDSSLPLKKRSVISTASGDVAKVGMKYQIREKEISDINIMRAKGQREADIARKVLQNVPRAIKGVKIRMEIMFQQAFSQGFALVQGDENEGTGVRADFGYLDSHTFHALAAGWSDSTNATPLDDIRQLITKADEDGTKINHFYLSDTYFNYMRRTDQVKELVATNNNQVIISAATLPVPGRAKTLEALADEFDAQFHGVGSSFRIEKADGTHTTVKPWAVGNVVGCTSDKVGRLCWGTLAEETNPVNGVDYQKSDYILVSEYSTNEPSLIEFTASQALAMPVIDNADEIFVLHADGTGVITVDPTTLNFTSAANTTGKKVTVTHSDKDWTASVPAEATWCTVTTSGNQITVKVSANTGSGATARTTTLTVEDTDGNKATVTINQAA